MFYVYVLRSLVNNDIYVGYTKNWKNRLNTHNKGKVRSTKAYKPWVLIYYEAYRKNKDATKRERKLKMHAVKKELIKRLENSLTIKQINT
jgi:putative endonuclease